MREALTNLIDATVEQFGQSFRCVVCDHEWHDELPAAANVHGEECRVLAAQKALSAPEAKTGEG